MPPISWTSKWRWPRTRQAASRTTAKASIKQVVERLAVVQALAELAPSTERSSSSSERLQLGLEVVDQRHELGQPPDLLALAGPEDPGEDAHDLPILPVPGHVLGPSPSEIRAGVGTADAPSPMGAAPG